MICIGSFETMRLRSWPGMGEFGGCVLLERGSVCLWGGGVVGASARHVGGVPSESPSLAPYDPTQGGLVTGCSLSALTPNGVELGRGRERVRAAGGGRSGRGTGKAR